MAKHISPSSRTLKTNNVVVVLLHLFLLAITLKCANSTRFLTDEDVDPSVPPLAPEASPSIQTPVADVVPVTGPVADLPISPLAPEDSPPIPTPVVDVAPITGPVADVAPVTGPVVEDSPPIPTPVVDVAPITSPVADVAPVTSPVVEDSPPIPTPVVDVAPITGPVADVAPVTSPVVEDSPPIPTPVVDVAPITSPITDVTPVTGPVESTSVHPPPLSFFMHDILGGSIPSTRVVAGTIVNTQINGLPFSKNNGGVFPINGGVPLINGLNNGGATTGSTNTILNNNGNNNVVTNQNALPFVTAGQIPAGSTLQQIMFGTITVIDDELTEGHELGAAVVGKVQGFYLSSSLDGSSQTMALTALFDHDHNEEDHDTLSFFGVHRTAAPVSEVAIVGGTGMHENAKGYASIETIHLTDQHTTDGVETLLHITVYISH